MNNTYKILILVSLIVLIILATILFFCIIKKENFKDKTSKDKLNLTLNKVTHILNKNNINDWFIGYGTLLGIIRNNSCIDNDDDIDIIINKNHKEDIIKLFKKYKNNIKENFAQFTIDSVTVDFYLCNVIGDDFHDKHENTIWKNIKPINHHKWNDVNLNIPNNPKVKLKNRYGENWNIPQNVKGNTNYIKNAPVKLI